MTTALGSLVQSVEYVYVETDPSRTVPTTDDSGLDILALAPEWEGLPDRFRTVLAELVDEAPGERRCTRCLTQPVGWVDEIRQSQPFSGIGYEVTMWRPVVLVAHPDGPVSVQCEECGPDAGSALYAPCCRSSDHR